MNQRILAMAKQCGLCDEDGDFYSAKNTAYQQFADLIVQACIQTALDKRRTEQELDALDDIHDRFHLIGNNSGIIDAVVAIRQKFQI
jgi:hypothetical protein